VFCVVKITTKIRGHQRTRHPATSTAATAFKRLWSNVRDYSVIMSSLGGGAAAHEVLQPYSGGIPGGLYASLTFEEGIEDQTAQSNGNACRRLTVFWDHTNREIDELMRKDEHPKIGEYLNMMWVQNLKAVSDWKSGEWLYAFLKSNADGYFDIWYSKKKGDVCEGMPELVVEPSGYVSREYFNPYSNYENAENEIHSSMLIRPNSDYNDYCHTRELMLPAQKRKVIPDEKPPKKGKK
jgi:hypothetical protein